MKLTIQKIKKLIKEELSKLTESSIDPQVQLFIDALSSDENIDIRTYREKIIVNITGDEYEDSLGSGMISEVFVYTYHIPTSSMTQGMLYSNDYGAPHEMYSNHKAYISARPKSALEFLKLINDKSGELK